MSRFVLTSVMLMFALFLTAQKHVMVSGIITDQQNNEPVEFVTIVLEGTRIEALSGPDGSYTIQIPAEQPTTLLFRRTGYKPVDHKLDPQPLGIILRLDIQLAPVETQMEVVVTAKRIEDAGMIRERVESLKLLPSTTGNLESILPHIALGASSGTGGELTSQYNVRGGNYDDNLVYVNDFEVYRPLLIRTGNQEGLSFPNLDLIRDLSFSSGGFESRFGDKAASVLDVRYKLPDSLRASASIGMLGATGHVEGSFPVGKDAYRKIRYLAGVRFKTTQYLLGSLDIKGEYVPSFSDYQLYITYDLSRDWQVGLLANLNRNKYDFAPESGQTAFGLVTTALQLTTDYSGAENDLFVNGMTGVSLSFVPDRKKDPLFAKLLLSGYKSLEMENLDIIGRYRLSQIETDLNNPNAGKEVALLGRGTQHFYSRNVLQVNILVAELRGGIELQHSARVTNFIQAGLRMTNDDVNDRIHEWERLDSAGYSLPNDPEALELYYVLNSSRDLGSIRMSGFAQNTFTRLYAGQKELRITGGVRWQYWEVNDEWVVSPRFQLTYTPGGQIGYRLAAGWYAQPPFYKELRRPDGTVNTNLKAQKSFHLLAGLSAGFGPEGSYGPKYKFIMEAYYKPLWDQVSYEVDNVRIRYSGENDASGYIAGIDFRINGELVPGAESWVNLSFLRARESLDGVQHFARKVGVPEGKPVVDVPRPTDQFMALNVFFQDYFPNNDNFRVHLNMSIGTGLPFGLKNDNQIFRNTYRFKPYHRVDMGFSFRLWKESWGNVRPNSIFSVTRDSWLSLEIFNLLQVRNEASRTWIKTIFKSQYAIPNYLSSRRLNIKFRCEF